MRDEVITTADGVRAVREEWLELVERHGVHGPGSDPDHLLARVRGAGEGARPLVLFVPGLVLVAGVLSPGRECHRVGYAKVRSPRLTILDVAPHGTVHDGSRVALGRGHSHLRSVLRSRTADLIQIGGIPLGDPLLVLLGGACRLPPEVEDLWLLEYAPGPFSETMARHSGVHRKTLRRHWRLLERAFGSHEVHSLASPDELPAFLDRALPVAAASWQSRLGAALTDEPPWREVLETEAARGRFCGYVLEAGGQALAYAVVWIYGDRGYLVVTGFRGEHGSFGPGTLVHLAAYEDLRDRDVRVLDLGIGTTHQKALYGTHVSMVATVRLHGPGMAGQCSLLLGTITLLVRCAYRRILGGPGIEKVKALLKARLRAGSKA